MPHNNANSLFSTTTRLNGTTTTNANQRHTNDAILRSKRRPKRGENCRVPITSSSISAVRVARLLRLLLCMFLILASGLDAQQFLTAADFRLALDEEPTTFLTEMDFSNARKYKDLLESKARKRSSILTQQRFYRGDIRGKAAWRRERHQKLQELRRRKHPTTTNGTNSSRANRRYNGVANVVKKWPSGRIPYVLSSTDYTERERAVLARAFQEYHSRTCIRFVPKTPLDHDFLYIGKIDGCYSDVGRAGGRQELSLDDGCLHVDTVIHELMHSVGFYHEHERWDRDNYLLILWQNIDREAYDQFGRVDLMESSYYGQKYDYHSIMHYDSLAFSRNGRETLLAKEPTMTAVIGSAIDFSPVDLAKIHRMYQCMELVPEDPLLLPAPPPPSSAILQTLEFTGDNSIVVPAPQLAPGVFSVAALPVPFAAAASIDLTAVSSRFPLPTAQQMSPASAAAANAVGGPPLARPRFTAAAAAATLPQAFRQLPTSTVRMENANNNAGSEMPTLPLYLRVNTAGMMMMSNAAADAAAMMDQQRSLFGRRATTSAMAMAAKTMQMPAPPSFSAQSSFSSQQMSSPESQARAGGSLQYHAMLAGGAGAEQQQQRQLNNVRHHHHPHVVHAFPVLIHPPASNRRRR